MSLQDLKDHGVLLPEGEWGEHSLETTVPQGALLLAFAVAVAALVAVFLGNGGTWTWIGLGVFLCTIYVITVVCDRAVVGQRRRVVEERRGRD